MFTVTTVSGFKMILEDAGRDGAGRQLWRQVPVGLPHAAPGPDGIICAHGCDAWSISFDCEQHASPGNTCQSPPLQ